MLFVKICPSRQGFLRIRNFLCWKIIKNNWLSSKIRAQLNCKFSVFSDDVISGLNDIIVPPNSSLCWILSSSVRKNNCRWNWTMNLLAWFTCVHPCFPLQFIIFNRYEGFHVLDFIVNHHTKWYEIPYCIVK